MAATFPLALDIANLERVVLRPGPDFSDEDFFEFCDEHRLLRIERTAEGEIIVMAPAGTESSLTGSEIFVQLHAWAQRDKRGIVLGADAGLTLPDTSVLSPDACWVPRERWNAVPRARRRAFAPLLPAFVIEVRSRTDRKKDLHQKMQVYMRNGVELGWSIDPQSKTVLVYKLGTDTPVELRDPDRVHGEGPVAGFVLELKSIYDELE